MGLFDFLKGRRAAEAQATDDDEDQAGPSVRYLFAHQVLPSVAFENPAGFLGAMSESNRHRVALLRDLWQQIRAQCPWDAASKAPAQFPIRPFMLCGHCGILIELPEPRRTTEAYLVAAVVHLPRADEPRSATPPPAWFFTLERADASLAALLPRSGESRLVAALRNDPTLFPRLLKETMFRGAFLRDLNERFVDHLKDPILLDIFGMMISDPDGLASDPSRFARFLDVYDREMSSVPTNTFLCARTADGRHLNYGPGSRPDYRSFLADLAVWFASRATSRPIATSSPASPTGPG